MGKAIAPGLANGRAVVLLDSIPVQASLTPVDSDAEILRLKRAFQSAGADLEALQAHVHQEFGASEAEIFAAHQLILEDPALLNDIIQRLDSDALRVEDAIAASVEEYAARMSKAQDPYLRERELDIRDIGNRLIRHAAGHPASRFSALEDNSIIVGEELLPSDLVELDSDKLAGVVTQRCGETSHVAILARALGVPALTGITDIGGSLSTGQHLLLDGYAGKLVIAPTQSQRQAFEQKQHRFNDYRDAQKADEHLPCQTMDGVEIQLMANLARPNEAELSASSNLAAIGLLRTEFLFLDHSEPPTVDEQIDLYAQVASRMPGRDICIRTLDLGGDKFPLFLRHSPEANPNLGIRGLRFSLGAGLSMFRTQVEALLRVSAEHRVNILLPMVLGVDDFLAAKDIILQIARELGLTVPPIGVLVETPAAVLLIDEILDHADFVNLGTNDLTQFLLASDRNALDAEDDYSVLHPAVLRAVKTVCSTAQAKNKPVTVCGEAAGSPEIAALLVGLGIRRLSMSPSLSMPVKYLLRTLSLATLEALAREAIEARSICRVKEIVRVAGIRGSYPES
ncbi:Phosphoenolpyruvate-protein phosphotransferase [Halioglobus japonicus]|nr:Phosphoenolpyruvate-protein phosphotransferase [Halioglobus japonicus]